MDYLGTTSTRDTQNKRPPEGQLANRPGEIFSNKWHTMGESVPCIVKSLAYIRYTRLRGVPPTAHNVESYPEGPSKVVHHSRATLSGSPPKKGT